VAMGTMVVPAMRTMMEGSEGNDGGAARRTKVEDGGGGVVCVYLATALPTAEHWTSKCLLNNKHVSLIYWPLPT